VLTGCDHRVVPWKLTVRAGPKVERSRFNSLDDALEAAERRGREIARTAHRPAIDAKIRQFEPIQQVAARIEVAGPERMFPSARGGLDVRGDGSIEAYVGGVRRQVVKQRGGETAYAALRRTLTNRTKPARADG
jgi:hypothetical protein